MFKKKNIEIIIGSNNKGKIKEIRDLLPKSYKIFTPIDFNLKSPKENGKSFIENSLIFMEGLKTLFLHLSQMVIDHFILQ